MKSLISEERTLKGWQEGQDTLCEQAGNGLSLRLHVTSHEGGTMLCGAQHTFWHQTALDAGTLDAMPCVTLHHAHLNGCVGSACATGTWFRQTEQHCSLGHRGSCRRAYLHAVG